MEQFEEYVIDPTGSLGIAVDGSPESPDTDLHEHEQPSPQQMCDVQAASSQLRIATNSQRKADHEYRADAGNQKEFEQIIQLSIADKETAKLHTISLRNDFLMVAYHVQRGKARGLRWIVGFSYFIHYSSSNSLNNFTSAFPLTSTFANKSGLRSLVKRNDCLRLHRAICS